MKYFLKCRDCDFCGDSTGFLKAKNPFNPEDDVWGCPSCCSVNNYDLVCDEPGCDEVVTCGTPTKDGYRQVCSEHYLKVRPDK